MRARPVPAAVARKLEHLERLAADPAAAAGERRNALAAARRIAEKYPALAARPPARPPFVWPGTAPPRRAAPRPWSGDAPTHGPVCTLTTMTGCEECRAIERWRAWLASTVTGNK